MRWSRALAALAGAAALEALGVPAGALIGAMLGAAALSLTRPRADTVPPAARFGAFAVLGWMVGARADQEALAALPDVAVPVLLVLAVLAASTAATTTLLVRLVGWSPQTALLAAAPGGLAEMIALGGVETDDVQIVAALHLLRLFVILLTVPALLPALGP